MKRVLCLLFTLTACSTAPVSASVCPRIRHYTREEQLNQANAEMALPESSPLIDPLLEWGSLRSQLKACNGE